MTPEMTIAAIAMVYTATGIRIAPKLSQSRNIIVPAEKTTGSDLMIFIFRSEDLSFRNKVVYRICITIKQPNPIIKKVSPSNIRKTSPSNANINAKINKGDCFVTWAM